MKYSQNFHINYGTPFEKEKETKAYTFPTI